MVKVWYMDNSDPTRDQREDHKYTPNRPVTVEDLYCKTGVEYFYRSDGQRNHIVARATFIRLLVPSFSCRGQAYLKASAMVKVWYMDNSDPTRDQREDHKYTPNRPVTVEDLYCKTGVEYFYFPLENGKERNEDSGLTEIRQKRGIIFEDEVDIRPDRLPNYEQQLKNFFTEHLHADDEIRYCLDGSGYFDVRDDHDDWIRIELNPGDVIIVPAGIYHRFTLDSNNYLKAKRYYTHGAENIPHNRPADDHPARRQYMNHRCLAHSV